MRGKTEQSTYTYISQNRQKCLDPNPELYSLYLPFSKPYTTAKARAVEKKT